MSKVKVTQIASASGKNKIFRQNLIGLGLNKLNKTVILDDTLSIRGMINKVRHLVQQEKIN